jgi:hypothetical protein
MLENLEMPLSLLRGDSLDKPPSTSSQGGLKFLDFYFQNCKMFLSEEISKYKPTLVITLGEPAHKLFISTLDNRTSIAESMQNAFTGTMVKAKFRGVEFDYSPCLHIRTFRVAEVYGDSVELFKDTLATYFEKAGDDNPGSPPTTAL